MALSYSHGASSTPLLGQTIGANLRATTARVPDGEALVCCHQDVRLSYRDMLEQISVLARALMAAGLGRGDRVGLWSPNRAEWVLTQYAAAQIGAILVNLNPSYRTEELRFALEHSGCRMLVAAPDFKSADYVAMVAQVRDQLPALERVVFFDRPDWQELLELGSQVSESELTQREAELDLSDPINIQYTSGTTGFPKGATLSHHNILNNGYFVGEYCHYSEHDRVCIPVPFYHCFGMVMGNLGATTHGATMVIPEAGFDPEATLRAVAQERCTSLYGVPTMFIAELAHPRFGDYDLGSLRTGIMAGSPCPIEVMRKVIERMHMSEVTICYGMTETSPVSTQTTAEDELERRVGTVGRVHPHVEVRITDPDSGRTLEAGEPGELLTRGYSVMLGYWEDAQRTGEAIDAARWMHTGDLATMDEQGYVKIVGRIKDMVIRGGENVYPREIEEFLYGHPEVADVQVIGVPDERYGEELMAWVIVQDGAQLEAAALRSYCEGRIAHFKIPRHWSFVSEFPMTVTGKVQKYKLREMAISELGLERVAATATG